jgi:hypothetical protein
MRSFHRIAAFIGACMGLASSAESVDQHTLTLFLHSSPTTASQPTMTAEQVTEFFSDTKKRTRKLFKLFSAHQGTAGVFASYGGFLACSDHEGRIVFPRLHSGDELQVIITPQAKPIVPLGNTVQFWFIPEKIPVECYSLKATPAGTTTQWTVNKINTPILNKISAMTLIIFADPLEAWLIPGNFTTPASADLILPPLLTSPSLHKELPALLVLKFAHFFAQTNRWLEKDKLVRSEIVLP